MGILLSSLVDICVSVWFLSSAPVEFVESLADRFQIILIHVVKIKAIEIAAQIAIVDRNRGEYSENILGSMALNTTTKQILKKNRDVRIQI